jgi:hypothetical protein
MKSARRYRNVLSRRTLLRGAGTVAIALPFLDAMRATSVYAAPAEPPVRALNVFFGLGFPTPLQAEGFAGPMQPLASLADKLLVIRGINHVRADADGINAHYDGAAGAFTAAKPNGEALAGGPSLDQVIRAGAYPSGLPTGVIPSLLMGTYFRRSRPARYVHSWRPDGSPADMPMETAEALFSRIFGQATPSGSQTPEQLRKLRYEQSVLDSLVGQYQHWTSPASNLGPASRARIADHLEQVREYEQRIFGESSTSCDAPEAPPGSVVPHGAAADPDGEGIDITLDALVGEWRLMAELYAMGVRCDRVRFGSVTFQAAGERIRLTGSYAHDGKTFEFDDKSQRGTGGSSGCSHEWWHDFSESKSNDALRAHAHLMQREVTYFLSLLDDPAHADENGRTILENSLITISTESGDGRHSDSKRELSGVYHVITAANGRFKTGSIVDVDAEGLDLYNTLIAAHGVAGKLGPTDRAVQQITSVLV